MSAKGGGFIIGLALGALVGAAAALLLAPESGEELRKDITEKGDELRSKAQQQADALQEQGRIVLSENVKKAQQVVQEAQVKLSKPVAVPDVPAEIPA
jgi:gas vesicle protein